MKAWLLTGIHPLNAKAAPLHFEELPAPVPGERDILIEVSCCGVCHTEIDEIEGRATPPHYPVIPGHQVIGRVKEVGKNAKRFTPGGRVGVAWIFSACGRCEYCIRGMENLCAEFKGTGRDAHGGYAQYMVVNEKFVYPIPEIFSDTEAAPLLCAGAIGFRSLKLTGLRDGAVLGLTGFGASGHLVLKMAQYLFPSSKFLVFARSKAEQSFSISLGADWAGDVNDKPPFQAHAIIDTTPVWSAIVKSLLHLRPGGRLVINAIRKEPADQEALLDLRYPEHLWMEKEVKSVANITRADVEDFLKLAAEIPIKPEVEIYPFEAANQALLDMKHKHAKGAKVLQVR